MYRHCVLHYAAPWAIDDLWRWRPSWQFTKVFWHSPANNDDTLPSIKAEKQDDGNWCTRHLGSSNNNMQHLFNNCTALLGKDMDSSDWRWALGRCPVILLVSLFWPSLLLKYPIRPSDHSNWAAQPYKKYWARAIWHRAINHLRVAQLNTFIGFQPTSIRKLVLVSNLNSLLLGPSLALLHTFWSRVGLHNSPLPISKASKTINLP